MAENEQTVDHTLALIAALVQGDRWLSADACAVYLGQRRADFGRISSRVDFPRPRAIGGESQWDVEAVESWAQHQRSSGPGRETCLYRHWNADGRLLYVGISLSAIQRLSQHRDRAGWYREIASVTVEWFSTRAKAVEAERIAIRHERPMHNVQGAPRQ